MNGAAELRAEAFFQDPDLTLESVDACLECGQLGLQVLLRQPLLDDIEPPLHPVEAAFDAVQPLFDTLQAGHQHVVLGLQPVEPLVDRVEMGVHPPLETVHGFAHDALDVRQHHLAVEPRQDRDQVFGHGPYRTSPPAPSGPAIHPGPGVHLPDTRLRDLVLKRLEADTKPEDAWSALVTLVVGRNGSGKSSFAEGLELLLTDETYRWENRSKVWRVGWRNLHHPKAKVAAELAPEGERAACTVAREWADGAELDQAADNPSFVPAAFEREFEELEVAIGAGAAVSFRGKIDRLDLSRTTGQVRVIDYKTGKYFYNRAAKALFPDRDVAEAVYHYATATGEYKRKACPATAEVDGTLTTVLSTLDGLAVAGVFPPVADRCRFCDFQAVCGPFRESRAERKSGDPRLAAFNRLREIP
jgi:energy-coupling factor transporter ATP-binding protein EcfA2